MNGELPVVTYQVSIEPDTPADRRMAERVLGWKFVTREDEGIWQVMMPGQVAEGEYVDVLVVGDDGDIKLSLEWP